MFSLWCDFSYGEFPSYFVYCGVLDVVLCSLGCRETHTEKISDYTGAQKTSACLYVYILKLDGYDNSFIYAQ